MDPDLASRLRDTVRADLHEQFGRVCVHRGYLSETQLQRVLEESPGLPLPETLVRRGLLTKEQVAGVLRDLVPAEGEEPRRLGRYTILKEIGKGGLGTVYKGHDAQLDRVVAIKMLRTDVLSPRVTSSQLAREAQTAAKLRHPNIVVVHDAGEIDGVPFIAMEYVDGLSLAEHLRRRQLSLEKIVDLLRKTAEAVGVAHEQGIVHRDLKPGNILVDARMEPRVIDFGLARLVDPGLAAHLTTSPVGTPYYMAPEQVRDAASAGPASDVYSLGVCLYEALTGRMPFEGKTPYQIFDRILKEEPAPPKALRPGVPRDLETICLKAMQKDPARRYPDAAALAADLARYRAGEPVHARPRTAGERAARWLVRQRGALAIAGVLMIAAGATWWAVTSRARARVAEDQRRRLEFERAVDEKLSPLEELIRDTKPLFYVKGADVRERLKRIESMLAEAEANSDRWTLIGIGWHLVGDLPRAEKALLRVESDPEAREVLWRIYQERAQAELLTESPALDDAKRLRAVEWVDRARRYGPVEAVRALVEGRWDDVVRLCEAELKRIGDRPGAEEYWYLIGWGKPEYLTKAIERRPHFPRAYLLRGNARRMQGKLAEAAEDYRLAVEGNPRLKEAFNNRGTLRYEQKDFDGALEDFGRAIAIDPEFGAAYLNRALVRGARREFREALDDCDHAIRLQPRLPFAYSNRGTIRMQSGDAEGAIQDYNLALDIDPKFAMAFSNRGAARMQRNEVDLALADYEAALAIQPDLVDASQGRGNVRRLKGDPRGAVADLDFVIARRPSAEAYASRGIAQIDLGEREAAVADLSEAIRRDANHPTAWYYRGTVYLELNRKEESFADLSEAVKVNPAYVPAWISRGILWEDRGDLDAAMADYDQALAIDPRSSDAWLSKAIVYQTRSQWGDAVSAYERALEYAPARWNNRPLADSGLAECRKRLNPK